MNDQIQIRPKERDAILQSLRAGVVPRVGQRHIQVGRAAEVTALLTDIDRVADGGSAVRFVIGDYGAGKTFFLLLVRAIAMEKKLVTMHADLAPDRRLHASGGQARSLYAELTRNTSTRTKPDGGALSVVVERFVSEAAKDARADGVGVEDKIRERLADLSELVGGFEFADVIACYCKAHEVGDEARKLAVLRWLRGEFDAKTDARKALGVRGIVGDADVYDQLKLLARFVTLAGYSGLLVCLDEMVNIYRLTHPKARSQNYEQLLRIVNDCLQGSAAGLGFIFGGTPEFLYDPRRGVYSYGALQSRLAENRFVRDGLVDYSSPVLKLANLTQKDLYVLLMNIRRVFASAGPGRVLLPDAGIQAFMAHCMERIGESYFRTPRTTITAFVNLLAVLEQNPGSTWEDLVGNVEVLRDEEPAFEAGSTDAAEEVTAGEPTEAPEADDLASFKL